MNNTPLFVVEQNDIKISERVQLMNAINSDCNINNIKSPEEKLRVFLLKYNTIILNMINNAMKTNYSKNQILFIKEFSTWKNSDGIQIDILFITYDGKLILFELKIRENIHNLKAPISQTAEYMEVIYRKDSHLIINSLRKNKDSMHKFDQFIKDNNICFEDLEKNLRETLKNKDVKAVIVIDKIDDKFAQEFEDTIRYTSFIKANIMLMEVCAYKYNAKYIITFNFYKNIHINLQPNVEKLLENINNNMEIEKKINENINKKIDKLYQIIKYSNVDTKEVNREEDSLCIRCTGISKEELSKLIIKEIYRLNPTSFNDLLKNTDLDRRIPSRSICYQIFSEVGIEKFRGVINLINYKTNDDKKEYVIDKLKEFYMEYKHVPTTKECTEIIGIHHNTVRYLFGKYSNAISSAGLKPRCTTSPSKEEIIQEIRDISKKVSKNTVAEYKNNGARYHWYLNYFGSFESALE